MPIESTRMQTQHEPKAPPPPFQTGDDRAQTLFQAATHFYSSLEAGNPIHSAEINFTLNHVFQTSLDTCGWQWKEAYDAVEAAVVLFLKTHLPAMREHCGQDKDDQLALMAMIERLAKLEPNHQHRSENQIQLQQFSTPLPIACAASAACGFRPEDSVLESSAGTGILAVFASTSLANPNQLHLNELDPLRHKLIKQIFNDANHSRLNGESIADRLDFTADVVLINPPFSATPNVERKWRGADLRHIRSAYHALKPGGRIVAITAANRVPGGEAYDSIFSCFGPGRQPKVIFTCPIAPALYRQRGTDFGTRLTVLEHFETPNQSAPPQDEAQTARELIQAVLAHVPPRRPPQEKTVSPPPRGGIQTKPESIQQPEPKQFEVAPTPNPGPQPQAIPAKPIKTPAQRKTPKHPSALPGLGLPQPGLFDDPETTKTPPEAPEAKANEHFQPVTIPDPLQITPGPDLQPEHTTQAQTHATTWHPRSFHIAGAKPHPIRLTESAAMAAIQHPVPTHAPLLPKKLIEQNTLSAAQIESIILAGEAHSRLLNEKWRIGDTWQTLVKADENQELETDEGERLSAPVQFRTGWMLGDGTGTGKGRQVAGVILDNWHRGRKRALWVSQSDKLLEDTKRDWCALGGSEADVIALGKHRTNDKIPFSAGILFTTYATLRSPARQGRRSRLEQITEWLAGNNTEANRHEFSGVIVFDEAHCLAGAAGSSKKRGKTPPSAQGIASLKLQHALPDARVMYVSATGATTIEGLAYAERLGLWGGGATPFHTREDFTTAMQMGGIAALEIVARDLKALGLYQARALDYTGIEVEILEHELTPPQHETFNTWADMFRVIHENIDKALEATGVTQGGKTINKNAKSAARAAFESAKQRFFSHLLTSMKCPTLIKSIEAELEAGNSAVIQLISTGEAILDRVLEQTPPAEWQDLRVDLTPRETVMDYLHHAYPTQLHEPYTDKDGRLQSRPVVDAAGNPVLCKFAVVARDEMVEQLAATPAAPPAIDQIIHHFGHEHVAEITGRSRRIIRVENAGHERHAVQSRPPSANLAETAAFMDGEKRILIFSQAGGTGRSYHADLSRANQQRRIHYLIEPGWRADVAIQGLGRTHRTHQASAPIFRPVTTNVKGERRFTSTIARRLDSLGAITRGQRNAQSNMTEDRSLFRECDNLESPHAHAALYQLYRAIYYGRIEAWSIQRLEKTTGLRLLQDGSLVNELPPMHTFLNRVLALRIEEQNEIFDHLETRILAKIEDAIAAGTFETGYETIRATSLVQKNEEEIATHQGTPTKLIEILQREPITAKSPDEIIQSSNLDPSRLRVNQKSGRAAYIEDAPCRIDTEGGIIHRKRLIRPTASELVDVSELGRSNWKPVHSVNFRQAWEKEVNDLPSHRETRFWLATGILLPDWDRFDTQSMRVRKLTTDCGQQHIGLVLSSTDHALTREAFGLKGQTDYSPTEIYQIVRNGGAFRIQPKWVIERRRIALGDRIIIAGPQDSDRARLKAMGVKLEILYHRIVYQIPSPEVLARVLEKHPVINQILEKQERRND